MTDPLSIAASVAGLVAFAGAVSKEVFQFFSSIKDAPENARVLVSALYSLNVTLGQVQTNLLDSRFVADHDGEDFKALNVCLLNCTAILSELERKVQKSGLGEVTRGRATRLRDAVQWSYTDDEIAEYLRRVEAEKSTLSIAIEAFTMRMMTEVYQYVQDTAKASRKMDRRLKDLHVCLTWIVKQATKNGGSGGHAIPERIESSVIAASSVYGEADLEKLLESSGSVLSLSLGELTEESVGARWQPCQTSPVPAKLTYSAFRRGPVLPDISGHPQPTTVIRPPSRRERPLSLLEATQTLANSGPQSAPLIVAGEKLSSHMKTHPRSPSPSGSNTTLASDSVNISSSLMTATQFVGMVIQKTNPFLTPFSGLPPGISSRTIAEDMQELSMRFRRVQDAIKNLANDKDLYLPLENMTGSLEIYAKFAVDAMQKSTIKSIVAAARSEEREKLRERAERKLSMAEALVRSMELAELLRLQKQQLLAQEKLADFMYATRAPAASELDGARDPPPAGVDAQVLGPQSERAKEVEARGSPRRPGEGWRALRCRVEVEGGGAGGGDGEGEGTERSLGGEGTERPLVGEGRSKSYGQSLRPPVPMKSRLRGLEGHGRSRSMGDLKE